MPNVIAACAIILGAKLVVAKQLKDGKDMSGLSTQVQKKMGNSSKKEENLVFPGTILLGLGWSQPKISWYFWRNLVGMCQRFLSWWDLSQLYVLKSLSITKLNLKNWHTESQRPTQVLLHCEPGRSISAIKFASFGTPSGTCGNFQKGTSHAPTSQAVLEKVRTCSKYCSSQYLYAPLSLIKLLNSIFPITMSKSSPSFPCCQKCIGQQECSVAAPSSNYADPCPN